MVIRSNQKYKNAYNLLKVDVIVFRNTGLKDAAPARQVKKKEKK
jgi:hypothetical protein